MEEIPFETIDAVASTFLEGTTTTVSSITSTTADVYAEYEECYNDPMFTIFTYTVDDMLLAASMAATVFNVMVIFCAIKLFKRSGDTMHLFILNMTVGDLVLTIFCHPNELLIRKHDFLQQKHLCAVVHYFNWIGLAVSGLSLTLLNVDKLIYFRWPLNYDRSMSKRRAAMFCLAIWAVSIGFVSYCWLFNIVYIFHQDCSLQMSPSKKFYYEIFTMLFCVLPVTSSLIVSIYLFNLTRSKRNATNAGDTSAFKNKVKSLAFIFATTTWTSCSLLPYRIVNLARIHLFTWSELSCEGKQRMNWIAWVLVYLLTLNPIINPLITSLIYAPYRLTIKKFLVNIPVGNRPLYSYQPDGLQSDSSFASVRRNRNRRSSCTELASLRQSTEVVRISMSEPPVTPMKSDDGFSFESQSSSDKKLQAGSK
ncbi:G-protein coupled receptors family 1 profile domain-containing protein [Caenorhabditis elegans]|uniref:G-protein coupled receptors family 1 profile domain-containing protein n=1 Tax=Caenorhabditis elegans TaxID=6239 RepID=A0A2K5AU02_CAEEL|nr:G-protein coupled receptors family 1 profile domain-containing protein [Caenorhabditis elegans]SPC48658.1 G-protein coupled receptors family 1 profile domain-containing protein [Caenorhabditis elegans]|eukprot:NP_001348797.1 AEX-2 related neuropeptide Receptor [Caenorhabditis elegans]